VTEPVRVTTIQEALNALGLEGNPISRRPVLRGRAGVLITLATLDDEGTPTWHGLWIAGASVSLLGPGVPACLLSEADRLSGSTASLVDLMQNAARSYVERLDELGSRVDDIEARSDPAPIADLAALQRALAATRKHVVRLATVANELSGNLGTRFSGLAAPLVQVQAEVAHLETLSAGLLQAVRDLVSIRAAVESNRLAESANELGRVSNRIAALANTSNLRMLGVAYLALVLGLVSAVVLIPNTAATILGMPSAAWVPGVWVDLILVLLAVVPITVVFSRRWVIRLLKGFTTYEARSAEGLSDLPEVAPQALDRPGEAERLIREAP
jgi:hypothetical protein